MKKKYAKIKDYKNSCDTFKYNTARYCQIIAKKYGTQDKQVKEYFEKFFDFLDSKGLLTEAVKNRINQNIKTFTLKMENPAIYSPNAAGLYSASDNIIRVHPRYKYNRNHVLTHEFIHLITSLSSTSSGDLKNISPVKGNNVFHYASKIGFVNFEESFNIDYEDYSYTFNKEDFKYLLNELLEPIVDSEVNSAKFVFSNLLHRQLEVLPEQVVTMDSLFKEIEISDEQEQMENLKREARIDKFINKNFKSPTRYALLVSANVALDINYDGKNFVVTAYTYDPECEQYFYYENQSNMLMEGTTELLARMFECQYLKKDIITFHGYNMNTKYCELLYRIYGDEFFEAFFEQSPKKLQNLMQLDDEEFNAFTSNIDELFNISPTEIAPIHDEIMNVIISCFADHLATEIINNLPLYHNSREIEIALEKSILDFASSMYDGHLNNCAFMEKNLRQSNLAYLYNDCVACLQEAVKIEGMGEFLGYEELGKVENVGLMSETRIDDFYSDINYVYDNNYYFTRDKLTQINPIDYVNGKELVVNDANKQEYLRKKAKLPTIDQANKIYQDYKNSIDNIY